MRKGWEYKKLGDLCDIYQPKTLATEQLVADGKYYVYGANGIIGRYNDYNHEQSEILLTCRGATCGTINISQPYSWINGNAMVIHRKSEDLSFDFLKYLMLSLDYSLIITGAAQPQITRQKIAPIIVKFPSLSVQQSIVSELDKINELIRLKKEQLKDYDNLAQSIFYEMFGDPVVNEKGWDNSTIESVCSSIVRGPFGSALKKEFFVEPTNDTYKVYEQKHAIQKNHIIGSYYITKEKFQELRRFEVFPGDIIMSCSGTIGEFYQIPKEAEKGVMNQALLKFTLNENRTTTEFFMFLMNFIKNSFETKGTGLQNIGSVKVIKSTILGLPPLPLQQTFAQRIELIEKQKAEVQRTIADLETLLASRMQYWFG